MLLREAGELPVTGRLPDGRSIVEKVGVAVESLRKQQKILRCYDVCIFLETHVLHMFWIIKTRQALDLGWDEVALMLFAVLSVDDPEIFSRHYIIYLTTVNP